MKCDVAVIGGGPAGYTAAEEAAKNGLSVVLFEKNKLGGTCLNAGCIPTKALLQEAAAYRNVKESAQLGIGVPQSTFDFKIMHDRKNKIVEALGNNIERMLIGRGVQIVYGTASVVESNRIMCNNLLYEAKNIIIATGSEAVIPAIPGIELPGVFTSRDILCGRGIWFDNLVIIGGGVIGVELASFYADLGCKVSILELSGQLLPGIDREIALRLKMLFEKKGIIIELNANVNCIEKVGQSLSVVYSCSGKTKELSGQGVLVATGRKSVIQNDISAQMDTMDTDEKESNGLLANLYVIGDANIESIKLAHFAMAEGKNVITKIISKDSLKDLSFVPVCVYVNPEIASVGMNQDSALAQNVKVKIKKYLAKANGKCIIEGSTEGFAKLVVDEATERILGAQLMCPHATELISVFTLAIQKKMKLSDMNEIIYPHPTISELIQGLLDS